MKIIKEKDFLGGTQDSFIKQKLNENQIIIFPSESSYGLAGNALSEIVIEKIHEMKKENSEKSVGVIINSLKKIESVVELTEKIEKFFQTNFSGAITILLKIKTNAACSKNGLIGVRIPGNKTALKLCSLVDYPLTATSANIHNEKPIFRSKKIEEVFGKEDCIFVDSGNLKEQSPSTYYSYSSKKILRGGKVSLKEIESALE